MGACCGSDEKEEERNQRNEPLAQEDSCIASPVASCKGLHLSHLPASAEAVHVHHVYDGDTLTLTDHRRVRVLGIDTPEVKQNQPFAIEARDELRRLTDRKDIFLAYDSTPGGDREDHYGRTLGFLYTKDGDKGYLFVNLHLVNVGLAGYYHPGDAQWAEESNFLAAQRSARDNGRGKWAGAARELAEEVVTTKHGKCYHKRSCEHLANSHNLITMTVSAAMDTGRSGCRTCFE